MFDLVAFEVVAFEVVVFEVVVEVAIPIAGSCGCRPGFWLAWLQPQILSR